MSRVKIQIWTEKLEHGETRSSKGEKGEEKKIYERNQKTELTEFEVIENKIVEETMCATITKHTRYEPKIRGNMVLNVENSETIFYEMKYWRKKFYKV